MDEAKDESENIRDDDICKDDTQEESQMIDMNAVAHGSGIHCSSDEQIKSRNAFVTTFQNFTSTLFKKFKVNSPLANEFELSCVSNKNYSVHNIQSTSSSCHEKKEESSSDKTEQRTLLNNTQESPNYCNDNHFNTLNIDEQHSVSKSAISLIENSMKNVVVNDLNDVENRRNEVQDMRSNIDEKFTTSKQTTQYCKRYLMLNNRQEDHQRRKFLKDQGSIENVKCDEERVSAENYQEYVMEPTYKEIYQDSNIENNIKNARDDILTDSPNINVNFIQHEYVMSRESDSSCSDYSDHSPMMNDNEHSTLKYDDDDHSIQIANDSTTLIDDENNTLIDCNDYNTLIDVEDFSILLDDNDHTSPIDGDDHRILIGYDHHHSTQIDGDDYNLQIGVNDGRISLYGEDYSTPLDDDNTSLINGDNHSISNDDDHHGTQIDVDADSSFINDYDHSSLIDNENYYTVVDGSDYASTIDGDDHSILMVDNHHITKINDGAHSSLTSNDHSVLINTDDRKNNKTKGVKCPEIGLLAQYYDDYEPYPDSDSGDSAVQ